MAAISRSADVSASPAVPVATSFIAADVGGAHVRLDHMVQASDAAIAIALPQLSLRRTRQSGSHPRGLSAATACCRCGGDRQRRRGTGRWQLPLSNTLPWTISPSRIGAALTVRNVHLVNDFDAVAYPAPQMEQRAVLQLSGPTPRHARTTGPILVVGPGTGLGQQCGSMPRRARSRAGHRSRSARAGRHA